MPNEDLPDAAESDQRAGAGRDSPRPPGANRDSVKPSGSNSDSPRPPGRDVGRRRDTSYRTNQLPAGVTMVQISRRFAAVRVRPGSGVTLRSEVGGPWVPLEIVQVTRARRPWVLRLTLTDGATLYLRPFLPGEAGLPDCGFRVGGVGDSVPLGNDPLSAVIALFAIAFYVLAAPFFVVTNWKRTKAARQLRENLDCARNAAGDARHEDP